jgi:hypothetical protein
MVGRLEDEDVPSRVGEQVGGDQAVVTGADDDGVGSGQRSFSSI